MSLENPYSHPIEEIDKSDELNAPLSSNFSSNFSKEYCLSKIKSFRYMTMPKM